MGLDSELLEIVFLKVRHCSLVGVAFARFFMGMLEIF